MNDFPTVLLEFGIVGAVLAWFMLRLERHLRRSNRILSYLARTLVLLVREENSAAALKLNEELNRMNDL